MTGALLPEGFHDRLPPHADAAAALERALLDAARLHGYERVEPPLVEFEIGLGGRLKAGGTRNAVRFVDPVSQQNLAIRPDITAQIGRIAATRMAHHPRPVRLSYAGPVLRLRGGQLTPLRERRQVGCELIGRDSVAAACEIARVAVEALAAAGFSGVSIDFTLPDLVETLANGPLSVTDVATLLGQLDAKDAGGVAALAPEYLPLIQAAGPFDAALAALRKFDTAGILKSRLDGLAEIAATLPGVRLTLDPTERHGFEYQSWLGFSIFVDGVTGEVGRGGSYTVMHEAGVEEPSIGVSLYTDALARLVAPPDARRRLFIPLESDAALTAGLRGEGWVTVAALDGNDSATAQLCTHELRDGAPKEI